MTTPDRRTLQRTPDDSEFASHILNEAERLASSSRVLRQSSQTLRQQCAELRNKIERLNSV